MIVPLSRRTWLWTSTAALAAACTRPEATRLPEAGAEGPRALTRRGAENLLALAELGAAIRWLHPSDGAAHSDWEPLLLDGVRSLEGAGTRAELVEGLRGLFESVAPTVVIWRREHVEGDQLDEPACLDPEAQPADAKDPSDSDQAEPSDAESSDAEPSEAESSEAESSDTDTSGADTSGADTSGVEPSDTESSEAESSDADVSDTESSGAVPSDARASDAESSNAESGNAESEPDEQKVTEPSPKEQPARPQPKPPDHDAGGEDRPPLPAELHAADDPFSIVQWHRRGYADGLAPACAERVVYLPGSDRACSSAAARKRRRPGSSCSTCMPPEGRPLAPAAPLQLQLPRGLASMIPLALWLRDGRPAADEGAEFGEAAALEYSLDDRGTRLLAVLRTWSLLRRFFPHPHPLTDPQALLLPALCTVAEQPTPLALRQAIEILLAGFQDGNAALLIATEQAAPRHLPELSLGWIEERVVVTRSAIEQVQPGDAITAINGVSIDNLLAEWLIRTPASTATAAIVRTVARLLERDRDGVVVELELDRQDDAGPRELTVQVVADRRADRRPMLADPRPSKPIVELDDGVVYLDATRIRRLAGAARRARRARVVIVDLRGELADPRGSVLAHFIDTGRALAIERMPTGPDPAGQLPLEPVGERRVEPDGPRLHARPLILADARTRGRAELELAGFDQLGATVIGSTSAGDLGAVATAWLPGGWQLRFTHGELRRLDGSRLWGLGVTPTLPIEPTRASLRAQVDPLLAAALELARKP